MLARKIQLEDRKNDVEYQLMSISQKLNDLTSFASILSQDSISAADMASIPSSLFMQGMGELANAHMYAEQQAQNNFNVAMSSGMFGENTDPYVQNLTMQKMYEDARRQYQKMLSAKLNEEEKSIQAKKARLDAQLAEIESELRGVEQRESKDVESSGIGRYGLA